MNNILSKIKYNDHYFDIIDTEEKAYWLGFIHADGCVTDTRFIMKLGIKDIEHLKLFAKNINIDTKHVKIKTDSTQYGVITYCYIQLNHKSFREGLISQGIKPRKSHNTQMIHLDPKLQHHYIRGVFDGDGSICIDKNNRVNMAITGTIDMCNDIHNELQYGSVSTDKTAFRWRLSGHPNGRKLRDYLYKDATVYLQRKYNKFLIV